MKNRHLINSNEDDVNMLDFFVNDLTANQDIGHTERWYLTYDNYTEAYPIDDLFADE